MSKEIAKLLEDLKETAVPISKISKETSIPANRMYKWFEGKGSPKHEDIVVLKAWLFKLTEKVPNGPKKIEVIDPAEYLIKIATRNSAYNRVILMAIAELLASHRGESIIKVLGELTRAVEAEQGRG